MSGASELKARSLASRKAAAVTRRMKAARERMSPLPERGSQADRVKSPGEILARVRSRLRAAGPSEKEES